MFLLVSLAWGFGAIELYNTFADFSAQWYWFVLATTYTMTLNEIFLHQILSHGKYTAKTQSWLYKILIFLTTVENSFGKPTNFCMFHRHHHMRPDTDEDMILPKRAWHSYNLLSPWMWLINTPVKITKQEQYMAQQTRFYRSMIEDPWTQFCEKNQVVLILVYWLVLFLIAPVLLFKIVFMGRLLMSIIMWFQSVAGHLKLPTGYKNFPNKRNDKTYNYLILHYLALGLASGMLHNNHHNLRTNQTTVARWFELDAGKYIRLLIQKFVVNRTQ